MKLPMKRPTLSPALRLDEQRMVDQIAGWVKAVSHRLESKEYSREFLRDELQKGLREGRLTLTNHAVMAADKGDEIADAALRAVYAEMQGAIHAATMLGGTVPKWGPGHLQISAYGQRAVLRAPNERGQGHRWHDGWMRNIQICRLIDAACREFGVRPTRNRASRRDDRAPSGISLVVAALARNKIHLHESSVQENIWKGLPGELVRCILGAP
jgi:hypothetical protein